MRQAFLRTSLLSVALVFVACSGGGGTTSSRAPSAAAGTTRPASAAAGTPQMSAAAGGTTVMLATSPLGQIVVDGQGKTLYAFTPDEADGKPTCYDKCKDAWPPLVAPDEITVGTGLDDSEFSSVPRSDDAGDQVKFGDWPLYYFASDTAPGQTNGQGVGGKWFVVGSDGQLIQPAASPS